MINQKKYLMKSILLIFTYSDDELYEKYSD